MMRGCVDRGEISPIRISVTQIWTSLSKILHMNSREDLFLCAASQS
jgi:hypothetical protein